MSWVAAALAGGLGAAARFAVDLLARGRTAGGVTISTVVVNITGSLAAGAVAGFVIGGALDAASSTVAAGGFLAAYTTFSTSMEQAARLLDAGHRTAAAGHLVTHLGLSCAAAATGLVLTVS